MDWVSIGVGMVIGEVIMFILTLVAIERGLKANISRWKIDEDGYYSCSSCDASALLDWAGASIDSNFCPNCGAKMDAADTNVGSKLQSS